MSEKPSAQIKGSSLGLFSPEEIRELMRIEFERAQRYRYPVVLLLISVDRLAQLSDLYGAEVKAEVLEALVFRLRASSRSSDFLASTWDDQVLVVVPHTEAGGVDALARRVLKEARNLQLECDGRQMRVTVSVGGAHNHRHEDVAFETMLEVARAGNEVSQRAGGDRYVHSELYDFFQKKREREGLLQAPAPMSAAGGVQFDVAGIGNLIGDKIRELFGLSAADAGLVERIEREVTTQLLRELRERHDRGQDGGDLEAQRKIELLERRIAKLTGQLGLTEEQLQNVLRMKNVDPGLASIYSSVQGLSSDQAQLELKRELMSKIFQANIELRQQRSVSGQQPFPSAI
jgi:diguanylate cyclase (GGDEF)-like protein